MAIPYAQRSHSYIGAHAAPRQRSSIGHAVWLIWDRTACKLGWLLVDRWHRIRELQTLAYELDAQVYKLERQVSLYRRAIAAAFNEAQVPLPPEAFPEAYPGRARHLSLVPSGETVAHKPVSGRPPWELMGDAPQDAPAGNSPSTRTTPDREESKPRRDPAAPFGYDEAGQPVVKYGYGKNGSIRLTKPRTRRSREVQQASPQDLGVKSTSPQRQSTDRIAIAEPSPVRSDKRSFWRRAIAAIGRLFRLRRSRGPASRSARLAA